MADTTMVCTVLGIIGGIALAIIAMTGIKIIRPYEQGLLEVLGSFKRRLNPGFNYVIPFVSRVMKLDLRTQTLDVPRQEVITKDNSPTNVDAVIYIKINDPKKAFYEIENYKLGTIFLAQTTLRSLIGEMELDQVLSSRETVNIQLRDILDQATDPWGVKVISVEIREVDPSNVVKRAMEAQTSSEREKRAAILKAEGSKRAAILSAEGQRQAKILAAEGVKISKILIAEGEKRTRILEAQGEAQKLRVISLGSATLDQKSLTVLSLDALKVLGNGQATKIVFPFEISKLLEGAADYIGSGRKIPEHRLSDIDGLESRIGSIDKVLGDLPSDDEGSSEVQAIIQDIPRSEATKKVVKAIPAASLKRIEGLAKK